LTGAIRRADFSNSRELPIMFMASILVLVYLAGEKTAAAEL
jgi:hypothetical protein